MRIKNTVCIGALYGFSFTENDLFEPLVPTPQGGPQARICNSNKVAVMNHMSLYLARSSNTSCSVRHAQARRVKFPMDMEQCQFVEQTICIYVPDVLESCQQSNATLYLLCSTKSIGSRVH